MYEFTGNCRGEENRYSNAIPPYGWATPYCGTAFFYHPDFTVGYGISPYQQNGKENSRQLADFTAGQGFHKQLCHLTPKKPVCLIDLQLIYTIKEEKSNCRRYSSDKLSGTV
jgi:hypothetical protein